MTDFRNRLKLLYNWISEVLVGKAIPVKREEEMRWLWSSRRTRSVNFVDVLRNSPLRCERNVTQPRLNDLYLYCRVPCV